MDQAHTQQRRHRRRWLVPALLAAAALLVAACSSSNDSNTSTDDTSTGAGAGRGATTVANASYPTVPIEMTDYAFNGPDTIDGGFTTLDVSNSGQESHQVQLARLNDGVTNDQIESALHGPAPESVAALVTFVGGLNSIEPQQQGQVIVNLTPGQYYLLCFTPDAQGKPHLTHGMFKPFAVTAAGAERPAPTSDGEIALKDMTITLPQDFSGNGTFVVTNAGPQVHEAAFLKLNDGKTVDDVTTFFQAAQSGQASGPPPFTEVGGPGAISPGQQEWMPLDLASGNYVALCFIPDPSKGFTPHLAQGMITAFTIS